MEQFLLCTPIHPFSLSLGAGWNASIVAWLLYIWVNLFTFIGFKSFKAAKENELSDYDKAVVDTIIDDAKLWFWLSLFAFLGSAFSIGILILPFVIFGFPVYYCIRLIEFLFKKGISKGIYLRAIGYYGFPILFIIIYGGYLKLKVYNYDIFLMMIVYAQNLWFGLTIAGIIFIFAVLPKFFLSKTKTQGIKSNEIEPKTLNSRYDIIPSRTLFLAITGIVILFFFLFSFFGNNEKRDLPPLPPLVGIAPSYVKSTIYLYDRTVKVSSTIYYNVEGWFFWGLSFQKNPWISFPLPNVNQSNIDNLTIEPGGDVFFTPSSNYFWIENYKSSSRIIVVLPIKTYRYSRGEGYLQINLNARLDKNKYVHALDIPRNWISVKRKDLPIPIHVIYSPENWEVNINLPSKKIELPKEKLVKFIIYNSSFKDVVISWQPK